MSAASPRLDRHACPRALLIGFLVFWLALAIKPWFRQDWLLENLVVFAVVPLFVVTVNRLRFSNLAYALLFVFLCAHELGAHYTYSLVALRQRAAGTDRAITRRRSCRYRRH